MIKIKKLFFIYFVFFNFSTNSYSEIVNKIDIKGNERISLETIIVFGDIAIRKKLSKF